MNIPFVVNLKEAKYIVNYSTSVVFCVFVTIYAYRKAQKESTVR